MKTTPNLAKLSRHGIIFENAFSTYDATPPSHFSLFTGLKKGFLSEKDRPDQSIAYHLKSIGYDSLGVSANYNVRKKTIRATRPFRKFLSPAEKYIRKKHRKFYDTVVVPRTQRLIKAFDMPSSSFNRNITNGSAPVVNTALDHLLESVRSPALIFANFMDAHDPYLPPEAFHTSEKNLPRGFSSDVRERKLPAWMRSPKRKIKDKKKLKKFLRRLRTVDNRAWSLTDDLSEAALEVYEKRYLEEVSYLDSQIGKTLDILDDRGFLENSLLIVTSDHGECFGEKGYITHSMGNRGDKRTSRHVPMLMVPNFAPLKKRIIVTERVSIADIPATVYGLLGIDDTQFTDIHGANYGTNHARHLPSLGRNEYRIQLESEAPAFNQAEDEEEMLKSLKALGYILDK